MNDTATILFIAIISIGIGFAIGSLVSYVMNSRQNPSQGEDKDAAGMGETLRVYRDPKTGSAVLQIKGKKYRRPQELEASERNYLEQQLGALLRWVKPDRNVESARVEKSSPKLSDQPAAGPLEQRLRITQQAETTAKQADPDETMKQSYNPLDVFARALRSDVSRPSASASSIAAQIDEILQEKLAGLPDEKRAIRLMELPGKGMVVMVGLDHYDGVDAVPDPDVRNLIRECVREWEQNLGRQE